LKEGWNVSLSERSATESNTKNKCGHQEKDLQFLSPEVKLTVTDENGDPVRSFETPLNIATFAYPLDSADDKVCFGYNNDKQSDDWKCNDNFKSRATKTKNVAWTQTSSDHLTSFAVLLGDFQIDSSCDGLDWISIASLSMIAAAVCFVSVCIVAYLWSETCQAIVGGYTTNARMTRLQKKVVNNKEVEQQQ